MRAALAAVMVAALPLSAVGACQGMVLHAHRGAPDAPENSLSGVRRAFEGGWDGAEIDIQQLRDRSWVLHHDLLLGRTTNGPGGMPYNLDRAAWQALTLKDRRGQPVRESPPFLADVLAGIGQRHDKVLNVEIKQPFLSCDAARQAVAVLSRGRPSGQWFLTAIDRRHLRCARQADPHAYLGLITLDARTMARASPVPFGWRTAAKSPALGKDWLQQLQHDIRPPGMTLESPR